VFISSGTGFYFGTKYLFVSRVFIFILFQHLIYSGIYNRIYMKEAVCDIRII